MAEVGFSSRIVTAAKNAADELDAGVKDYVQVGCTGFYIIRDKDDSRFIVSAEISHNGKSYFMAFGR